MEEISELPSASSLVAALFPKSGPSSLDDEQSFDSSMSLVSPPLKCDHFMWKCLLDGPTDPLPVNALIDSGAHMVLIRSALVCKLGLPRLPLETPELVNVAINVTNAPSSITHYTQIAPTSLSCTFQLKLLHAVIIDNLSVPLILGLPFLVTNSVSCNYACRECNVTVHDHTINLLGQVCQHYPSSDVL